MELYNYLIGKKSLSRNVSETPDVLLIAVSLNNLKRTFLSPLARN